MVQIVSVNPAGAVDDEAAAMELEVPALAPVPEVGATSTDEGVGRVVPVASVLETWLACDVQVVLLQEE